MNNVVSKFLFAFLLGLSTSAMANSFVLSSTDIVQGKEMKKNQEFQGFGCNGQNASPQLSWSGVPEGTEAFAILAYDPDAPSGSGWWHWLLVNIPKNVRSLDTGAGDVQRKLLPIESMHMQNDYGQKGYGGACPPKQHGFHRYQFTIHALSKKLDLPENASGALTGYMVKAHSLGSSTIEALYKRD